MPPPSARRIRPALLLALCSLLALLALARPARAWVEVHVAADEARLAVDASGAARVEHQVTLKISGGPLPALDVRGVDADAQPEPDGYVVPQKSAQAGSLAAAAPIALELLPRDERPREDGAPRPPVLRIRFDGLGLPRGVYVLLFRYRTDLAQRGLLRPDGAAARLAWSGPIWDDGLDTARLVVELPPAPTEPRVDEPKPHDDDTAAAPAPPLTLSTLRRSSDKDELELVRPYAPKGEPIRWAIRADARAFRGAEPAPQPGAQQRGPLAALERAAAWSPERRQTLWLAAAGALFALYAALVALKARETARLAAAAGAEPRPLVPIPLALRAAGAGLALVAGVALELRLEDGTLGAVLVALATALAAHRTPRVRRGTSLRGPGKWLPVAEAEAFRLPPRPRGALLDVSTRAGKALLIALLAALGAAAWAVHATSPYHAHLVAFDATALLAIFCTGRLAELPPDPVARPIPFFRDVSRRVKKALKGADARVVGRIRVPDGSPDADELRLGLVPRLPLPGFVSIEVGLIWAHGAGGVIGLPEILLRVVEGSPCDRAVARIARSGRVLRGRRPDERVIAFSPRLPTARLTAAIAAALARAVVAPAAAPAAEAPKKVKAARRRGKKAAAAAPA